VLQQRDHIVSANLPERLSMVHVAPSMLSLVAAAAYVAVAVACLLGATLARRHRQPPAHWRTWIVIALVFLLLAAMRGSGLEELIRQSLRDLLRLEGVYYERRSYQRWLAVAVILGISGLFAAGLWWQLRKTRARRSTALLAAQASTLVMVMLVSLRIVSLHQVDQLLYGPIKLNWFADLGASLATFAAAVIYVRVLVGSGKGGRR
jgi:UDP-N-acetylmuramyl pentapeptide phosphotransferase/UDP-N-acetylglucosamine-1-phosphate transferase